MNQAMDLFSETVYDAWLASACIPPDLLRQLIGMYGDSARCFTAFDEKDPLFCQIIPDRFLGLLAKNGTENSMRRMESMISKYAIRVIRFNDQEYPSALKMIEQPPAILFYQGNLQCLQNRILAMVGSRAASYAGQKAAIKLSAELSRQGVSIVSGLACGIEASAHQGCIEGGSATIAVTACGLDTVYPRDNTPLRDQILNNNGLVLTEYAPGEKPAGWHFPVRNRLITALGQALILIEARIRSGSMTSVHPALDQGKDVFVYPGDPLSEQYEGNHQLLREGGIYFTSAEDVLRDMHWLDNQTAIRQNSDCCTETVQRSPEQSCVINALKPGCLSFEQLLDKTGMDVPDLMSTLTILQICGQIESLPGKQYQLKH